MSGLLLSSAASCFAQQTIFNVPSADVTPVHQFYLEHESQFRAWQPGEYWYVGSFFATGLTPDSELDATLFNVSSPASHNITLGVGPKWSKALTKAYNLHLTLGGQGLFSLEGQGVGTWLYGHLSAKIPGNGPRLTAGLSGGTRQLFGTNTVHFIGGVEQPITAKLSAITDWFSGAQSLGFWTSGFSYAATPSTTLYLGYQVPNRSASAGRQGLTFEISTLFS